MSNLQQFFGPPATTFVSVPEEAPYTHTTTPVVITAAVSRNANGLTRILSGTTVANTYKTVLNVTGGGNINFLGAITVSSTNRNLDLRLTLDGVAVGTISATGLTATDKILPMVGAIRGINASPTSDIFAFDSIRFNSSLQVEIKSSLSETDFTGILIKYNLT